MEISCGAVVIHDTKYLVLKYGYGHWGFVKGHIETDETPEETLFRELEEETGIQKKDITVVTGFKESISYFYKKDNEIVSKEVIYYLIQCTTKDVSLSFEHADFAWLSYLEALQRITYDNDKHVLQKAHEFLQRL